MLSYRSLPVPHLLHARIIIHHNHDHRALHLLLLFRSNVLMIFVLLPLLLLLPRWSEQVLTITRLPLLTTYTHTTHHVNRFLWWLSFGNAHIYPAPPFLYPLPFFAHMYLPPFPFFSMSGLVWNHLTRHCKWTICQTPIVFRPRDAVESIRQRYHRSLCQMLHRPQGIWMDALCLYQPSLSLILYNPNPNLFSPPPLF